MGVPQVAIVGRPNVGKSSLFNWLAGKRLAIVDPTAGVTRDRVTFLAQFGERFVELVDTGGIGIEDVDNLTEEIEEQIQAAIDSAAVILFVVDTREGITPLDSKVAERLRYVQAPVICVANKTDHPGLESQADEFYQFGRKVVHVSAKEGRGKDELLDAVLEKLPPEDLETKPPEEGVMKVAIVGRRNTGKSTLVNTLAQAERVIVSEVPGTTRDSIDVRYEMDGKTFIAIDTPGFRRGKSMSDRHRFLQLAPRPAGDPPGRRGAVVLRRLAADQQGRQAALRLHRPAVQALHLRGQQVGPHGRHDADGEVGHVPPRHLPHDALRAHRLHHGPDRQEREGHAQPRPDALQAIADAAFHRAAQQALAGGRSRRTLRPRTRTAVRGSTSPPRWPSSRPRSCSFATIRN